ncbi:MAG: hypothetical protein HY814_06020 [Candidatus Riflebacteria bacterium]|nr:hypothetical protein [Candidatus Riflebacteria bacterium]
MMRRIHRATAWSLMFVFTLSLLPVSLMAAEIPTPNGQVTDTQPGTNPTVTGGSQASVTGGGVPAVNPNDPRNYPYGYYPTGAQYGHGGQTSILPTVIGAAFGGLLGSHFGMIGTLAGAAVGGFVGRFVGQQIGQPAYGNYYDNYNNRLDQYYTDYYAQYGQQRSNLGILPGIAGAVFGALVGSSVGGTLGLVVGGVAGFLVGQVFARVLFPGNYYDNYYAGGNYPWDSFRTLPTPFQSPNTYPQTGYYGGTTGYPPVGSVQEGYYPYAGSAVAPAGNLGVLRTNFFKATSNYEGVLKSGTVQQKQQARQAFEAARDAYFSQKGPKNP